MTHPLQLTALDEIGQLLAEPGFDGLADAPRVLLDEVMKLERAAVLGADPSRRAEGRIGYANEGPGVIRLLSAQELTDTLLHNLKGYRLLCGIELSYRHFKQAFGRRWPRSERASVSSLLLAYRDAMR